MTVRLLDTTRRSHKAQALTSRFSLRIVGQTDATGALSEVIEKYQSGFYDRTKPIASLLFLGPTGVGKTGVAEAFAEGLFGSPDHMMKIDCAEFQHSHEIAKLIGSPPGYLGHRETHPFFTNEAVTKFHTAELPFTIILFDEIEKASDALWNLMLGILDKGTMTTGTNEKVDLTQTIIIMTSNVGAADIADEDSIGFNAGEKQFSNKQKEDIVVAAARRKFMPEFLNRLDKMVMFKTLTPADLDSLLSLQLDILWERIVTRSIIPFTFSVSPAAFRQMLKEGYSRRDNARYLKRTIEKYVALPLGRLVSTGQIMPNNEIIVDFVEGDWKYYAQTASARAATQGDILAG